MSEDEKFEHWWESKGLAQRYLRGSSEFNLCLSAFMAGINTGPETIEELLDARDRIIEKLAALG